MSVYIGVVRVTRYKRLYELYVSEELYELYRYSGSTYRPKKRWVLTETKILPTFLCSRVSLCANTIRISEGAQDSGIRTPLGP